MVKVRFYESELLPDGSGGFTTNGASILSLLTFASVKQIRASRTAEALQEQIDTVYEITLRQRFGFDPRSYQTVSMRDVLYVITGIAEDIEDLRMKYWKITIVGRGISI